VLIINWKTDEREREELVGGNGESSKRKTGDVQKSVGVG
jgi:hypothetical protein